MRVNGYGVFTKDGDLYAFFGTYVDGLNWLSEQPAVHGYTIRPCEIIVVASKREQE